MKRPPPKKSLVKREMLESDGVRKAIEAAGENIKLLSREELSQSLHRTIEQAPNKKSIWVFGYGSLIWNPMLNFTKKALVTIHGYHRGFYLWSRINRGNPEIPGLVLALDRGGSCRGMAYKLPTKTFREELEILWRREMLGRAYSPRWVNIQIDGVSQHALTFVIDRASEAYTGKLKDKAIIKIIKTAKGHYGSSLDYLYQTAESFRENNITDRKIFKLEAQLKKS